MGKFAGQVMGLSGGDSIGEVKAFNWGGGGDIYGHVFFNLK